MPMGIWRLDPRVTHLNHGSFGACPQPVLEVQQRWRAEMEHNPVRFFMETLQPAVHVARISLAAFVGADPEGLVFVPNATAGINSVLQTVESDVGPGDELLISTNLAPDRRVATSTTLRQAL